MTSFSLNQRYSIIILFDRLTCQIIKMKEEESLQNHKADICFSIAYQNYIKTIPLKQNCSIICTLTFWITTVLLEFYPVNESVLINTGFPLTLLAMHSHFSIFTYAQITRKKGLVAWIKELANKLDHIVYEEDGRDDVWVSQQMYNAARRTTKRRADRMGYTNRNMMENLVQMEIEAEFQGIRINRVFSGMVMALFGFYIWQGTVKSIREYEENPQFLWVLLRDFLLLCRCAFFAFIAFLASRKGFKSTRKPAFILLHLAKDILWYILKVLVFTIMIVIKRSIRLIKQIRYSYSHRYEHRTPLHESEQCSICTLPLVEGRRICLPCKGKHIYHFDCIQKWSRIKLSCPMCREDIKDLII